MGIWIILVIYAVIMMIVNFATAHTFKLIAEIKGFRGEPFFWWTFFFGVVGWAMVIALPDRKENVSSEENPPYYY